MRFGSAGSVSSFSRAGYHVLSELGMWFAQVGLANWRPIIVKDAMYDVMQRLHSLWQTLASTRHEVTAVLWWYRNVRFIWETQWRLRFFAITGWGHELLCQHDMIIMNDYLNNFISSWFWDFVPQVLCRLFHALGIMCCLTWACGLHRLGLPTDVQ